MILVRGQVSLLIATLLSGAVLNSTAIATERRASSASPIRIEAESMTLSVYRVETNKTASAGKLLSLKGAVNGQAKIGKAAYTFTGTPGRYDILVGYYDENDGIARMDVLLGGQKLDSWDWNKDLGANFAHPKTFQKRTVGRGVNLQPGQVIQLVGKENLDEHVRIDYLEFVPVNATSLSRITSQPPKQTQLARSADSFVDSIGTNLHLHHVGIYQKGFDSIVEPKLKELGIRHVRDGGIDSRVPDYYERIRRLTAAGIKFTFIFDPRGFQNLSNFDKFVAKIPGAIAAIEGPNEFDNRNGPDWRERLIPYQKELFRAVKSNPETAKTPVIAPSIVHRDNWAKLGLIEQVVDYGNLHNYYGGFYPGTTGWGSGGYGSLTWSLNKSKLVSGLKPMMSTETGYHNVVNVKLSHKGVPEDIAGKYIPRLFLLHFNRGIARTYQYELVDGGTNPTNTENHYGLVRNNGSPKPAYTTLKNLIALLRDPGPSFKPGSLNFSLLNSNEDINYTLLQKRNRTYYLIIWKEVSAFDVNSSQRLTVEPQHITMMLSTPVSKATLYQPNLSATAGKTYFNPKSLDLSVTDTPLIVELRP